MLQNVQYNLWYVESSVKLEAFFEDLFLQVLVVVKLPPIYFMCMFSCILNRVFGVKQLVAFFASDTENISFIICRHNNVRAFIIWICVV